jgi:hypothetical protein
MGTAQLPMGTLADGAEGIKNGNSAEIKVVLILT